MPHGLEGRLRIIVAAVAVAAAALVSAVFFGRFHAPAVVAERTAEPLAAALLVAAAAIACGAGAVKAGAMLVRRIAPQSADGDAGGDVPLSEELLVGVPLFGTLIGIVSLAVGINELSATAITLLLALLGVLFRWRRLATLRPLPKGSAWLLPPLVIAVASALAPVNTPDELAYKLAVPKAYLLHGGMVDLPLNSQSYIATSIYLADLPAIALAGGSGAKLLHLFLYFATLVVLLRLGIRLTPERPVWPAVLIAWTPALAVIAGWAWAEWALLGLLLIAIARFDEYVDSHDATCLSVALLAVAGAVSAKYTALPFAFFFALAALWQLRRRTGLLRLASVATLLLLFCGGFFYARNFAWTGSPVAPFLLPDAPAVAEYRSDAGGWIELLHGDDVFHPGIIDDSVGVLLPIALLLSPFVLLLRHRLLSTLLFVGAAQLFVLIPIAPTARLTMLGSVPLAIAGCAVVLSLLDAARRSAGMAFSFFVAVALAGQLLLVGWIFVTSWQFLPYLVGAESERQYVGRTRDYVPAWDWIAAHTGEDAKLLLLGENRTFHLERRSEAAGNLDGPRVIAWLTRLGTPEALREETKRRDITHLLIHKPWYRVERPGLPPLTMLEREYVLSMPPAADSLVRTFAARYGTPVYSDRAYVIFELR